ncbi:MAG: sensor histidine kinase [Aristaeellaceae bacterium]
MLYLVLFVALMLGMLWLFQVVGLNDFYRWYKTRQVKGTAAALMDNLDNSELSVLADELASQHDVCILILDADNHIMLSSEDTQFCLIHRMSQRDLTWWCERAPEDGSILLEEFNVQPFQNDRYNPRKFADGAPPMRVSHHQSLLYAQRIILPGGEMGYMLINTMITPLDATVAVLRSQLIMITGVVLLGALLMAVFISRKLSLPIIETNTAARELSTGRFQPTQHGGDYQEIAELNATLTQAAEDLHRVEKMQHELIANISHDLRTPLTMIGGYAEVMRDIPGESTPENMQVIIDETTRLTTLVNEIMDFSRMQADELPMVSADFDLTASVQEIVERISTLVEPKGYTIRYDAREHPTVMADEKRIGQVIYNLIGNALTYTGEDKLVIVTQQQVGERVRLSVQDTGKGIPKAELPMIWHRYYRTQETHRRAVIGSGLGLSIVQGILMRHQVPYGVESEEGKGSTFWFELPLSPADESSPRER